MSQQSFTFYETIGRFFIWETYGGSWIATPTQHGTAERRRFDDRQDAIDYAMAESETVDVIYPVRRRKRKTPERFLADPDRR